MVAILVLGLVLFILGVGGIYAYDQFPVTSAKLATDKAALLKSREEARVAAKKAFDDANKAASASRIAANLKTFQNGVAQSNKDFVDRLYQQAAQGNKARRTIVPGKVKVGYHKPNDIPTETEQTMTLEEMINEIQGMKKK